MSSLGKTIRNSKSVRIILGFSKSWKPSGFEGASLYEVSVLFLKAMDKGSITSRASSTAFNFFLALFPAIIFLFTLIPYIPVHNFQNQLLELLENILPHTAYKATRNTLIDIIRHQRGGLLSLGFIMALYFSTNGIHSLMEAFNRSYHLVETRSFIKQRSISIILTIFLSILLVFSILLLVFSESALSYLIKIGILKDAFLYYMLLFGRWVIIVALMLVGISILYYFAPAQRKGNRIFSTGAIIATIFTLLTCIGFTYFVNHFGQYNKLYGSIGTLIVILLWIYFNSLILLIGFELNNSINIARKIEKKRVLKNMLKEER